MTNENENTDMLMSVIYDSDAIFLSAIEADDPSELESIIRKYKDNMHKDIYNVDLADIQWKEIYDDLKSIDSPVDFIEKKNNDIEQDSKEMSSDLNYWPKQ